MRAIEKADYDALHKDYSESVDALEHIPLLFKELAAKSGLAVVP